MQKSTLLNTEYSTDVQQEPIEHRFNPYQGKYRAKGINWPIQIEGKTYTNV